MKIKSTCLLLSAAALFVVCGSLKLPSAAADTEANSSLHITIALASAKTIAPGQPVVLHYLLSNSSASQAARFDVGQNGTAWYHLSLRDAEGHSATAIPDSRPLTPPSSGLYQTGDRTLDPNASLEGDIVVTRYFTVARPGHYILTVVVPLNYTTKIKSEDPLEQEAIPTALRLDQTFVYPIEVTAPNPAAVQATAEMLRKRLMSNTNAQWKTSAEELFSMPPAQAFSSWQQIVTDPATPNGILIEVADQLAYHPSRISAQLLTQMAWNPARLSDNGTIPPESIVAQSEITKALSHLNAVADVPLKQYIRSLFVANGTPPSEIRFHD